MKYMDKTCRDFLGELSSKNPVPGGGGASALVGSLGMALGSMVGELTVGKKKYQHVEKEIRQLMQLEETLRKELLDLVDKDAEVFTPLAKAYGMPKSTEDERVEKEKVMAVALKDACTVPLEIMKKCCEGIQLLEDFAAKGSTLAISDAGVGVVFCKAALQGASLNVFINTGLMKDKVYASKLNDKADAMLDEYVKRADIVYNTVVKRLK